MASIVSLALKYLMEIINNLSQNTYFLHGRSQTKLSFSVIVVTDLLRITQGCNSSSKVLDIFQEHNSEDSEASLGGIIGLSLPSFSRGDRGS